jgi:hypothetical protein
MSLVVLGLGGVLTAVASAQTPKREKGAIFLERLRTRPDAHPRKPAPRKGPFHDFSLAPFLLVGAFVLTLANDANAQEGWELFRIFNTAGASAGGGRASIRGAGDDPLVAAIRPEEETVSGVSFGAFLGRGNARFAVLFPEIDGGTLGIGTEHLEGSVTLGSKTVPFDTTQTRTSAAAVLVSAKASPLRNGRVWVRGGIGGGWLSRSVTAEDTRLKIDLETQSGLAWLGASGVRVWQRRLNTLLVASDLEYRYLAVKASGVRASLSAVTVGLTLASAK